MTPILILADSISPALTALEAQIKGLLGAEAVVQVFNSLEALQEQLMKTPDATVVCPMNEQLEAQVAQCRILQASCAFIAWYQAEDVLDFSWENAEFQWLRLPAEPQVLKSQLAAANREVQCRLRLEKGKRIDEVTSLMYRRYFLQRLGEEMSLSRRHVSPFCCVVLSVSLYALYVDSYGYQFVNQLFSFLAGRIRGMVRHEDVLARTGDDEIAILLPHSTEQSAKTFLTRLLASLNQLNFQYGGYEEQLQIQAGVAGYPLSNLPVTDADAMLRYARHALYQAKNGYDADEEAESGNSQICLFSEIKPTV